MCLSLTFLCVYFEIIVFGSGWRAYLEIIDGDWKCARCLWSISPLLVERFYVCYGYDSTTPRFLRLVTLTERVIGVVWTSEREKLSEVYIIVVMGAG